MVSDKAGIVLGTLIEGGVLFLLFKCKILIVSNMIDWSVRYTARLSAQKIRRGSGRGREIGAKCLVG